MQCVIFFSVMPPLQAWAHGAVIKEVYKSGMEGWICELKFEPAPGDLASNACNYAIRIIF